MEHITDGRIKIKCSNCKIEFIKWRIELGKDNFHSRHCYIEFIRKGKHPIIGRGAENHPNWKGGRVFFNRDGYRMIYIKNHPRSHQNIIAEHILVMEKIIGRYIKKGEEVHHLNHIRNDNRPENLALCNSHSEHLKKFPHRRKVLQKKDNRTGRFVK